MYQDKKPWEQPQQPRQPQQPQQQRQPQQPQQQMEQQALPEKAVGGFVEIFNFIGQFIISNKFVESIGNMFKSHIEVINYAIKENETKEFWKLVGKYALVLFAVFGIRSFFGGILKPLVFGAIAIVSFAMIKLGRQKQEVNFKPRDNVGFEFKSPPTDNNSRNNKKEEYEEPPEYEETQRYEEPQGPTFTFVEPEIESKVPTEDSMDSMRNMFSQIQDTQRQGVQDMVKGDKNMIERAMTPDRVKAFGLDKVSSEQRVGGIIERMSEIKKDTKRQVEEVNKEFMGVRSLLDNN